MPGAQFSVEDPRNEKVLIYVNGDLVPRAAAVVSVFDAGFMLGDGIWESFRLVNGELILRDPHLDRLFAGARAIGLEIGMTREEIIAAISETLRANDMSDGVHLRLMVTRGVKSAPNQDPRLSIGNATVVIVAEYRMPDPKLAERGITLFTSSVRCSATDAFDMRLNSHSRLPLIIALRQAVDAGADEALMLDPLGFVASCNSTNFFMVRNGAVWTSSSDYSFNGITRQAVLRLARDSGIRAHERNFSVVDVYESDECFVTGTFPGVVHVRQLDGRLIGTGKPGPVTSQLRDLYNSALLSGFAGF